jgi:hypothetical protein
MIRILGAADLFWLAELGQFYQYQGFLPSQHLVMSMADFQMYVKFAETYCPNFIAEKKASLVDNRIN